MENVFFAHCTCIAGYIFFSGNLRSDHLMVNKYADPFWNDILIAWSHYKYYNPVKFKKNYFPTPLPEFSYTGRRKTSQY